MALVTSSADKTSWECPTTQSGQHIIVYCCLKIETNYLCSTHFVIYGILKSSLSAYDFTRAEYYINYTVVREWLILMLLSDTPTLGQLKKLYEFFVLFNLNTLYLVVTDTKGILLNI